MREAEACKGPANQEAVDRQRILSLGEKETVKTLKIRSRKDRKTLKGEGKEGKIKKMVDKKPAKVRSRKGERVISRRTGWIFCCGGGGGGGNLKWAKESKRGEKT